jgi:hypothetical protein
MAETAKHLLDVTQKASEEIEKKAYQTPEQAASPFPEQQAKSEDQQDDASTASTTSNSQDSVFSEESIETSITAFSKSSGFSDEQIQSATRAFVSILQEDEVLMPLYESARYNTRIEPKRLRRHIRRAIKAYAENLKEEANDHLEFSASLLVRAKARYAAQYIVSEEGRYGQSQNLVNDRNRASKDAEDSSDEETTERTVDETDFGDLKAFRMFLTGSNAFVALREQTHAFCTKSSKNNRLKPPIATRSSIKRTWCAWQRDIQTLAGSLLLGFDWTFLGNAALYLLLDVIFLLTDDFLIATGYLEPPLEVGWTRIRNECVRRYICVFAN